MVNKKSACILILAAVVALVGIGVRGESAFAFPRGAIATNITVNPGAIPSGGLATVTVSYLCPGSGCFDKGGMGQLIVKPTGIFKQVSTCSFGALGNVTVPGSYACFGGPLSNDAIVNYGGQRLPTNQILVPPPEPASPELHILQAVVEANAAVPGTTLIICYQEEPVANFTDPRFLNGSYTPSTDILTLITRSIPDGDPPDTVVENASGVYASLCVFVMVTSGSPQHIRLLDVTTSNVAVGGRLVVRALITDQNWNPVHGVNVSFSVSDPTQASLTCSVTGDFGIGGYTFNPINAGSFPGPAGLPSFGVPKPGASADGQAGSQTLGSPFPADLLAGDEPDLYNTLWGYTCYSGTALGGVTGLGTVPPGTITVLTDNIGVAYITMVGLAHGAVGNGVVITATVYGGGVPPTALSARSTPFVVAGAVEAAHATVSVTPTAISSPANQAQVTACFTTANNLPVASGQTVGFTIVQRSAEILSATFAQAEMLTGDNGCAVATVLATGSGNVTVSAAMGSLATTATISVGTSTAAAGQSGSFRETPPPAGAKIWASSPSGSTGACPVSGQWMGLYWKGATSPVAIALESCLGVGKIWKRVGSTWYGAVPPAGASASPGAVAAAAASDSFDMTNGEFAFLYGK